LQLYSNYHSNSKNEYDKAQGGDDVTRLKTKPDSVCPIANAALLLGDRWTLVILRDLADGSMRFGELEDTSGGISPRTLVDRLRQMEVQGLITRESFREIPPRVEYTLTHKGRAALPVIDALREFGDTWLSEEEKQCC
jgi:DNA-binding HxlR family transcriptional regulator